MFTLGKILKWGLWLYGGLFLYHFYCVMKKDKPELMPGVCESHLTMAYNARDAYYFLYDLLTKPPVQSLL